MDNRTISFKTILMVSALSFAAHVSSATLINSNAQNKSALSFLSLPFSYLKNGHAVLQLGAYEGIQGAQQRIAIEDLVGDEFTVTHKRDSNGLAGLGYFINGQEKDRFSTLYGINAFYLAKTAVKGNVIQEDLFTNLAYQYYVTHYPVYAVVKSMLNTSAQPYALTLDAGVGANFMRTSAFQEFALTENTLPDTIFSGRTTTAFSATVGAGIRFNELFGKMPLECGYRFFYLGRGKFNKETTQVVDELDTGDAYAHALLCSLTV